MILLIVVVGLFSVTIIGLLLSLKKFDTLKEKWGGVIAYAPASLFAIFLALLSIYLPLYLSQRAESENTIHLLKNGYYDIYQTRQDLIGLYSLMKKDSLEEYSYIATINRNGLPTPRIFLRLLGNETILKSMNDEMIESARRFESNTIKINKWFSDNTLLNSKVSMLINLYGAEIWKMEEIMKLYIECLEQGKSDSVFFTQKQAILNKYLSNPGSFQKSKAKQHPWLKLGP